MNDGRITIIAKIGPDLFREFAIYDAFVYKKRGIRPMIFAVFFLLVAIIAFTRRSYTEGAALLGVVLLVVGLGLPAIYILRYLYSVSKRAKGFSGDETAYALILNTVGVDVEKGEQSMHYSWDQITFACRLSHSICLYVTSNHAFLLPREDADSAAAWDMIREHIPPSKVKEYR